MKKRKKTYLPYPLSFVEPNIKHLHQGTRRPRSCPFGGCIPTFVNVIVNEKENQENKGYEYSPRLTLPYLTIPAKTLARCCSNYHLLLK